MKEKILLHYCNENKWNNQQQICYFHIKIYPHRSWHTKIDPHREHATHMDSLSILRYIWTRLYYYWRVWKPLRIRYKKTLNHYLVTTTRNEQIKRLLKSSKDVFFFVYLVVTYLIATLSASLFLLEISFRLSYWTQKFDRYFGGVNSWLQSLQKYK